MQTYSYVCAENAILLESGIRAKLPMRMKVNGVSKTLVLCEKRDTQAVYACDDCRANVYFDEDCVRLKFSRTFPAETEIFESVLFDGGLAIEGLDRVLSVQPRNNAGLNMEFFDHLPDVSANGYFSPAELNMILGSSHGFLALGLLDLPDSKLCRLQSDLTLLVESCGGNKRCTVYEAPELLLTFPEDEWQAVALFREKLIAYGRYVPQKPRYRDIPAWWKDPLICTYGDQILQDRVGDRIDEDWVRSFVDCAERDWGHKSINLVIDDSWQPIQSFAPRADERHFPDLRAFIEEMHVRGHHVILWTQPLFDSTGNGFLPLSREMDVLSGYSLEKAFGEYFKGSFSVDYTADNARAFLRRVCEGLFGSGEGQFHADGVKLDFMGMMRDPALTRTYAHPERGIGMKELYLFYRMFAEEARAVRPDVLIDCSVCDPRFEEFITHDRLHDTHAGVEEKELRARLVTLACPDLLIDSDGALMYRSWLKRHYINAAIYAVPSNYYLHGYQDFRHWENGPEITQEDAAHHDLTPAERKAYGVLFEMPKLRPNGHAVTDGSGAWRLLTENGQVNAISLNGDTVIYYPEQPGEKGYLFTFRDETMTLPLFGRRLRAITPAPQRDYLRCDFARDRMSVHLTPGVLHTFVWEEDAGGIESGFSAGKTLSSETTMNYVN